MDGGDIVVLQAGCSLRFTTESSQTHGVTSERLRQNFDGYLPPFSSPVFYVDITTTIPDTASFEATVTFTYTDAQLDSAGVTQKDSLTVEWFNPTTQVWSDVNGILDTGNNTITFTTDHFSVYALAQVTPTAIAEGARTTLPSDFVLYAARPNPFNPATAISYEVSRSAHVTLVVYNMIGQEVIRLVDAYHTPGRYRAVWHGRTAQGRSVASGIYVYRMTASTGFSAARRMALVR